MGCNLRGMVFHELEVDASVNPLVAASTVENIVLVIPKGDFIFQPSIFRGYVSFREGRTFLSGRKRT